MRVAPATFTVTNTSDSGAGSLRQAILDANAASGADTIVFGPLFTTPQTISLTTTPDTTNPSALTITDSVTITGPGANLLTVRRDPTAPQMRIFDVNGGSPSNVITVSISGMTISGGNTAGNGTSLPSGANGEGAALLMFSDHVTLDGVVITGNTSGSEGGGIGVVSEGLTLSLNAFLTVRNSTISGNTSTGTPPADGFGGAGGGIYFGDSGSLLLENSTVSGNTAMHSTAGGIYFYGGIGSDGFTIRNCTITGNVSPGANGGEAGGAAGIFFLFQAPGTANIQNCTITNNTITGGAAGGGGIGVFPQPFAGIQGTVAITSSVVANNTGANSPDVSGPVTASFSLIRDQTGSTITDLGHNLAAGTNPMLGPLANNGGPTQTMALLPGSPLIDKGSNPASLTTDQRGPGFARVSGPAADIGAIEVQSAQASVQSSTVNAGQINMVQRSMVTNVTVTFDRVVSFTGPATNAFQLTRTGPGTPTGNVGLTVDVTGSTPTQTIAKLTFSGPLTEGSPTNASLIDGNYTLTVFSAGITGGLTGGDQSSTLFRLFGDVNGDKAVNGLDLTAFRNAFGSVSTDANYLSFLDFNGDGAINGTDLTQFRNRFGVILP
jgi:parallel beta-helix repeat protein